MRYYRIRSEVLKGNKLLASSGLIVNTQGNVSVYDQIKKVIAIKPSGVPYNNLRKRDIVVLDLNGNKKYGKLKPSTDFPIHLEIYKSFPHICSVVHTHSVWATSWAQSCMSIPILGTTHADYYVDEIPCTKDLSKSEIIEDYEKNIGKSIVEILSQCDENRFLPAVLIARHGAFSFGESPEKAVSSAIDLENIAEIAGRTIALRNKKIKMPKALVEKHFYRKHGKNLYYGQNSA